MYDFILYLQLQVPAYIVMVFLFDQKINLNLN
jgi:hypothetical protein